MYIDKQRKIINDRTKKNKKSGLSGISTGFKDLDEINSGWQKSEFVVVGARPGMGKTAFSLALAKNAIEKSNVSVAFFSLVLTSNQLTDMLISIDTEIPIAKIKSGNFSSKESKQIENSLTNLEKLSLYIDDTFSLSINDLIDKIKILKAKNNIEIVVIDGLYFLSPSIDTKKSYNASVSNELKLLARELDITIIGTSELNRNVEYRGGAKRPVISDLAGLTRLEDYSDMIIFLYRADYYGITQDEDGLDCRGRVEIIVAKNRNGIKSTIRTAYKQDIVKFEDFEDINFNEKYHNKPL